MNNNNEEHEIIDIESAALMRRLLMNQIRNTSDPLYQSLMELERLGSNFNIENCMDYDSDTSDLEGLL